jgi:hypothetical protein
MVMTSGGKDCECGRKKDGTNKFTHEFSPQKQNAGMQSMPLLWALFLKNANRRLKRRMESATQDHAIHGIRLKAFSGLTENRDAASQHPCRCRELSKDAHSATDN